MATPTNPVVRISTTPTPAFRNFTTPQKTTLNASGGVTMAAVTTGVSFYEIAEIRGNDTLKYLSKMLPLPPSDAGLVAKYVDVKKTLDEAVGMARAQDGDKRKIEEAMVRGSYGILKLACDLHTGPAADFLPLLPAEQDFRNVCLAAKDRRNDVMTPAMGSVLSRLGEPQMGNSPGLPETDHGFAEPVYFATGIAMRAEQAYNPPRRLGA